MERFTDEQIREYNDAFCMFDKKNLGSILISEMRDMLKTIGFNPTDRLLENLSIVIDEDSNGKIDFHEFIDLIDKLETEEKNDFEGNDFFFFKPVVEWFLAYFYLVSTRHFGLK